jgi:DeoR family fructose operon transcriptional repressor
MTMRRALKMLERDGRARLVRGGAVHVGSEEFAIRQSRALSAKKKIAEKIAPLLGAHETVGFDASSTVHVLAQNMPEVERLMVITYGVEAFQSLQGKQNITAILSGGERDSRTGSLVGFVAQQTVSGFSMDCCILSASGIDPEAGTMEPTMEEVEMKQSMAKASQRVIVAADATKLSRRSSVRSFDLAQADLLVTECDPRDPRLDPYRNIVDLR